MNSLSLLSLFRQDTNYIYATGEVRAREVRFLDKRLLSKILEIEDKKDWENIKEEFSFFPEAKKVSPSNYKEWIKEEMSLLFQFLRFHLDETTFSIFQIPYDYHNLRVIIKEYLGDQGLIDSSLPYGRIPADKLSKLLKEEKEDKEIPPDLLTTYKMGIELYNQIKDGASLEGLIFKNSYKALEERVNIVGNSFIKNWFQIKVDLQNISTTMRCKVESRNFKDFLNFHYLEGGMVPLDIYRDTWEKTWDQLPALFEPTPYGELVQNVISGKGPDVEFSNWERLKNQYILDFLKLNFYTPFGVEVVFAFGQRAELELRIILGALLGREHQISPQRIKESIPLEYW